MSQALFASLPDLLFLSLENYELLGWSIMPVVGFSAART